MLAAGACQAGSKVILSPGSREMSAHHKNDLGTYPALGPISYNFLPRDLALLLKSLSRTHVIAIFAVVGNNKLDPPVNSFWSMSIARSQH